LVPGGSAFASDFHLGFTQNLNLAFICRVRQEKRALASADALKSAPHNEQAVNSQHLAFLSRRRDIY
jgi:hypothetical protein